MALVTCEHSDFAPTPLDNLLPDVTAVDAFGKRVQQ